MHARSNDHVCIKLFSGAFRVSNRAGDETDSRHGGVIVPAAFDLEIRFLPPRSRSIFLPFSLPFLSLELFSPFFSSRFLSSLNLINLSGSNLGLLLIVLTFP